MKESPILFSGPLVRALLAGTKTQTRRLMKPQPVPCSDALGTVAGDYEWRYSKHSAVVTHDPTRSAGILDRCRYGAKGDRLWVKETWATLTGNGVRVVYRADGEDPRTGWSDVPPERRPAMRWQPSIHMSRRQSRISLEVTEVRVQRLQDISEEDAKAEGVTTEPQQGLLNGKPATLYPMTHRQAFIWLWDAINGERAPWASNPWCWAITFSRCA